MTWRRQLRSPILIWALTVALWATVIVAWVIRIGDQFDRHPFKSWLLDWHVYAAGAHDLLDRTLYLVPLESQFRIPVDTFNLPPAAAALAVPLLWLPDRIGGAVFVLLNIAAIAAAAVIAMYLVRVRYPWLWAAAIVAAYSVTTWSIPGLLGNNSPLILLLVAGFVAVHLADRSVAAGALLGVAIAIKLWPATFLVVLARERDWKTIGWAAGTAATIMVVGLLWLGGPRVIGPMVAALQYRDEIAPTQFVVGITWLRQNVSWWPEWGGYLISLLILLIPARGMTGYGLATLAGMAAIPNLWRHYWGTVIFGVLLLVRGLVDRREERGRPRSQAHPDAATAAPLPDASPDPGFGS